MQCYLVAGEFKRDSKRPHVVKIWSSRKQRLVDVNRPVSVLLFSERRFADAWAKRSNQLVYEVELNEPKEGE